MFSWENLSRNDTNIKSVTLARRGPPHLMWQCLHGYGFSPVWIRMWRLSLKWKKPRIAHIRKKTHVFNPYLKASTAAYEHCWHWCGFSPVCAALRCRSSLVLSTNRAPHSLQWCGRSPVWWYRSCRLRPPAVLKPRVHPEEAPARHLKSLLCRWWRRCALRPGLKEKKPTNDRCDKSSLGTCKS